MKRFEYKTVEFEFRKSSTLERGIRGLFIDESVEGSLTEQFDDKLNSLGEQGWELVSTTQKMTNGFTDTILGIFKREM